MCESVYLNHKRTRELKWKVAQASLSGSTVAKLIIIVNNEYIKFFDHSIARQCNPSDIPLYDVHILFINPQVNTVCLYKELMYISIKGSRMKVGRRQYEEVRWSVRRRRYVRRPWLAAGSCLKSIKFLKVYQ